MIGRVNTSVRCAALGRRRWGLVSASLVICLLCLSGCGGRGAITPPQAQVATPTQVATPAIPAVSSLVWTPQQLPVAQTPATPGSGFQPEQPTLGVAQSDSAMAYVCAPPTSASETSVRTWVTRDRGATWRQGASLTVDVGSPLQVVSCQIKVDASQADTAVAQVGFLPAAPCFPGVDCVNYALYLSTNAGQSWARLQPPKSQTTTQWPMSGQPLYQTLPAFATRQGVTYAIFGSAPRSASISAVTFVVSHDGMRSWTPITGLDASGILGLWVNPVSGSMLVMTTDHMYNHETFLTSVDGGATWRTLAAPPFPFSIDDVAVQQPFTDQPWRICGGDPSSMTINGVQQNKHMDDLACTADGGASWRIHRLDVPNNLGGGIHGSANYNLIGIADDGSALLTTPSGLERIAGDSGAEQSLGHAPEVGLLVYAAGSGNGVFWAVPQSGYPDANPQGRFFTAAYA